MTQSEQILKNRNLRLTKSRAAVLDFFLEQKYAIPHSDIEVELEQLDRVTIYRTLSSFLEKGLIHEINDGSGAIKYAICKEHCIDGKHLDNHVHFKCTRCEQTSCLESIHIPRLELPQGYKVKNASLLMEGVCKECNI